MSDSLKSLAFGSDQVPIPGFGAMGLSHHGLGTDLTLEEAEPVLIKAVELGCTFWDTAVSALISSKGSHSHLVLQVIYNRGANEKLLGDFIKKHKIRDKLFGMAL